MEPTLSYWLILELLRNSYKRTHQKIIQLIRQVTVLFCWDTAVFRTQRIISYFLLLPGDSEWSFKRSVSRTSTTDVKEIKDIDDEKDDETGKIINKERSETGRVRLFIYGEFNLFGSRVTRLPELPWASRLFIHFLTQRCEPSTRESKGWLR